MALLILSAGGIRLGVRPQEYTPLIILQFTERRLSSDLSSSQGSTSEPNPKRKWPSKATEDKPLSAPTVVAPEPSNAITPDIDSSDETARMAQRKMPDEEAEKSRRNLSGPSDSQLDWARSNAPVLNEHHRFGDTERVEGGEVITWENDKCYWTTRGITTFGMQAKVCKDPEKPDGDLFKDMRERLDERNTNRTP